jgi:twitching motility protein PilT
VSLVPSLLQAIVHVDGEALVMHAGDKPYVVSPTGQVDLATRGLALDAVNGIVNQLLPQELQQALDEFGAVQHELAPLAEFPGEHFTIVAARGGDDVWVEIRRRRIPDDDRVPEELFNSADVTTVAPYPVYASAGSPSLSRPVEPLPDSLEVGDIGIGPEEPSYSEVPSLEAPYQDSVEVDVDLDVADLPLKQPELPPPSPRESQAAIERRIEEAVVSPPPLPQPIAVPPPVAFVPPPPVAVAPPPPPVVAPIAVVAPPPVAVAPPPVVAAPPPVVAEPPAPVAIVPPPMAAVPPPVVVPAFVETVTAPVAEPERAESYVEPHVSHAAPVAEVSESTPAVAEVEIAESPRPVFSAPTVVPMPVAAANPSPGPAAVSTPTERPVAPPAAASMPAPPPPPAVVPEPPRTPVPAPVVASAPEPAAEPSPAPSVVDIAPPPAQPAVVLPLARNPIRAEQPWPPVGDARTSGLDRLLRLSAARGASTMYLSSDSRPGVRVDGELQTLEGEPVLTARDVESLLLTLMPERNHEALRTGAATEWILDIEDVGRVRCMSFRDHRGPGGVFRLMPTRSVSVDQLGLPRVVQGLAIEPEGLVLVAGPRSSGKRTLISAFVDFINRTRRDHVITIEREINIVHERGSSFISQREVRGNDEDLLAAARAALREDPDVLVIEDLRSAGLMTVALEASASGHLVVGGFSAHTATATVDRIIDLYSPDHRRQVQLGLADSLRGIVVQVLLRKSGGGRVAAREVLLNTPAVSSVIAEGKTSQLPMAIEGGRRYGMVPLNDALVGLVQQGVVDGRDAYRYASDRQGLLAAFKHQGLDTSFVERLA